MRESKKYTGIDLGKMVFACLIPLLHIEGGGALSEIIYQYGSRLGVPYFFAVSGFFLSNSIKQSGNRSALIKYEKRLVVLFLFWLGIYMPVLILKYTDKRYLIQIIIFQTPAYLWYLLAMIFAAIPFCLFSERKRNLLFGISIVLYIVGTLFGGSYKWLTGGMPIYDSIFLTTRNGLFFGLPFMMIGEKAGNQKKINKSFMFPALLVLYIEIYMVGNKAFPGDDRSMYFLLPLTIFVLVNILKQYNPSISTSDLRRASSAIYVMQFGTITFGMHFFEFIGMPDKIIFLFTYVITLVIPILVSFVMKNRKIVKYIF